MTSSAPEVDKVVKGVLDNAQKKLIVAIVLCALFMVVELVAGIFAHSLAILTDAAHMLSDVCSFGISLFAIHISGLPGTIKMSFGYARAEILGALISILLIWGLTIWLVGEAVNRIINPQEVKAPIMVYTAIFGIVTNIALASVLDHHHHHHHGGHHGHHSHHEHSHDHDHCHHGHEHKHTSGGEQSDDQVHAEPEKLLVTATKNDDETRTENATIVASVASSLSPSANSGSVALDELPTPSAGAAAESYRAAASMLKDLSRRSIGTPCDSTRRQTKMKESADDFYVSIEDEPAYQMSSEVSRSCDGHSQSKNINVSAAYLHALGDLLQNLGVLVGGLVIWWKPSWTVADPICTLLFSVLVFSTTFGILRDAANVLMEGTPTGIDPTRIVADLRTIPNVSEVHDVHVWSLSVGKPSLACHIVIDDPTKAKRVLASATSLIQVKYLILHTTIQIDFSSNKSSCETDAHIKCH